MAIAYRMNTSPMVMEITEIIDIDENVLRVVLKKTGLPANLSRRYAQLFDRNRITVPRWLYLKLIETVD
jgi:hypothetical protein